MSSLGPIYIFILILLTILLSLKYRSITIIILISMAIRVIFIIVNYYTEFIPFQWDEIQFVNETFRIVDSITVNNFNFSFSVSPSVFYYSLLNSPIIYFFGKSVILLRITTAFLSIIVLVRMFKLVEQLSNVIIAKKMILIISFLPSYLIFSTIYMRDIFNLLLFIEFFIIFRRIQKKITLNSLISIIIISYIAYLIRGFNLFFIIFYILSYFLIKYIYTNIKFSTFRLIILFVSFVSLIILLENSSIGNYLVQYIIRESNYRASGGSAYLIDYRYSNITDIILYSPLKTLYFLYYPFLWNVDSLSDLIIFVETTFYIIISLNILLHFLKNKGLFKQLIINPIYWFMTLGLILSSAVDSNGGTATRHRSLFVWILILLFLNNQYYKNIKRKQEIEN